MKKKSVLSLCMLASVVTGISLVSCRNQSIELTPPPPVTVNYDIVKAKEIFNQNISITKSIPYTGKKYVFSEANLTPDWAGAVYAENSKIAAYNMPVSKLRGEILIEGYNKTGEYEKVIIPLMQKIVVAKNIVNDSSSVLIMTLVPTLDYYTKDPEYWKRFVYGRKSKDDFSGLVFYEDNTGKPLVIHCYTDGKFDGFARFTEAHQDVKIQSQTKLVADQVTIIGYRPSGGGSSTDYSAWHSNIVENSDFAHHPQERVDHIAPEEYGGTVGFTGDNNYDKPLTHEIVASMANLIMTDTYYDLTSFLKSPVTSSSTRNISVYVRGVNVTIRGISISGAYPNGSRFNIFMRPVSYSYPTFPDGKGITMHFYTENSNGNMSITMLKNEYDKIF